jgi:hypothetical protein
MPLERAQLWCLNQRRQSKTKENKALNKINLRLRLLSESKLVISKQGQRLKHARTGRAESVPCKAYQCLIQGVSKCALFVGSGKSTRDGNL